ncbi:MAG: DNA metabolism protein [Ruminococcaceae bacterium]|nr:DNA metabolism protein [Oscillospiraceae bacterium]
MTIYTYDGSFMGFLSVVFEIYETKRIPSAIVCDNEYQTDFFSEVSFVKTDEAKAERVERKLIHHLGNDGFSRILSAFSCGVDSSRKGLIIFNFIRLVLKHGGSVCEMYNLHAVSEFNSLAHKTDKEAHYMQGFLRFRIVSDGTLIAEYAPDNDITHFLIPYFSHRNAENRFIIRDTNREIYGLYNGSEWTLASNEPRLARIFEDIAYSEDELVFRELWQQYYDTVSIASRKNERMRSQFMPRRYWKYLTEIVI